MLVSLAIAFALAAILALAVVLAIAAGFAVAGGFAGAIFDEGVSGFHGAVRVDGERPGVKPGHSGAGEHHFGGFSHSSLGFSFWSDASRQRAEASAKKWIREKIRKSGLFGCAAKA
ncbi:MAG: hypothetical protein KGJ37_04775 [Verrucomicrobiota bacterium]|nr:hypothetical protein [Verrucomicrobiota bacterium]